ncbi:carboxymuconolactone decarboxylase family protein [Burkholderia sp. PAMC 26561]
MGKIPNMIGILSNSPAALEGYLSLSGSLAKGALPLATRERIAIAVADINGCHYCLSAHAFIGKKLAKLDDAEIAANRKGSSGDRKADAALRFVVELIEKRGHLDDGAWNAVRGAGYDTAQIIEIISNVALNMFTNLLNEAVQTELDFPSIENAPV